MLHVILGSACQATAHWVHSRRATGVGVGVTAWLGNLQPPLLAQAYHVKEDQTDDAIRCGNLHCFNRAKWEDDSLEWLLGGAYGDLAPSVVALRELPTIVASPASRTPSSPPPSEASTADFDERLGRSTDRPGD